MLCDQVNIHENIHSWFRKLSIVLKKLFVSENLEKNLSLKKQYKSDQLSSLLKDFGLDHLKLDDKGSRLDNLSGGEKQRINISRALNDSEIIVLDEPTSSLDTNSELKIKDILIKLKGKNNYFSIS